MEAFKVKNGLSAKRYLGSNGVETAGSEAYSLAAASYDSVSFSVAAQIGTPTGLFFKPDGTRVFIADFTNQDISEYSLGTAWDLTTTSYVTAFSISGQDTNPWGLFFKDDGTTFYLVGRGNDFIYQYSMSTAWNISTATYTGKSFSTLSEDSTIQDIHFKSDGTKMYAVGNGSIGLYQYSLSTAWDISTASYDSVNVDLSGQLTSVAGLFVKPSGDYLYVVSSGSIFEYVLSIAWDLSTASYTNVSADLTATQGTSTYGLSFKAGGTKMYVVSGNNDAVYQYSTVSLTQTLDLSTGTYFSFTPSGSTTVSFTNPPASGLAIGFSVEIIGDGSAITWPASVKWHEATAPTATASKELYTFVTTDGGTTYYGKKAAEGIA